jgi:polysaccharide biosynthesis protein PslJ
MDIGELFRLLRSRWAVTVPAFILVIISVAAVYKVLPTQYQSQVQLTMMPPPKMSDEAGNYGNPYLAFGSNLSIDVDFLTRNLTSDAAAQELAKRGMTDAYTAAFANNALGPFMLLTVTGPDKPRIAQSIQVLVSFAQQQWLSLQLASYAPRDSIVGLEEIAPPSTPASARKKKIEVTAGVAIGGMVLAVLLGVIVDTSIRRRNGWRQAPTDGHRQPEETAAREVPARRFEVPTRFVPMR